MCNKSEDEKFRAEFNSFKARRVEMLERKFDECKEILELSARMDVIIKRLTAKVPDGLQEDMIDCCDFNTELLIHAEAYFYEQGFSDAFRLLKLCNYWPL